MGSLNEKIVSGAAILGTMLSEVACPNVVRIMRTAGFEFMIVDCEHGYFDFSQIAALASVGRGFGLPIIVRVPTVERGFIAKVLDMGVDGLLAPMISRPVDAERLVRLAKYPPMGERGLSTTRAHTNYNPPGLDEYVKLANANIVIMVQIETLEAVANAGGIAAIEGVDVLMIGPNDLAASLGAPGKLDSAEMDDAISKAAVAAKECGKPCGIIDSRTGFLRKWRERGMTVVSCGSEVGMMMKAGKTMVADFNGK